MSFFDSIKHFVGNVGHEIKQDFTPSNIIHGAENIASNAVASAVPGGQSFFQAIQIPQVRNVVKPIAQGTANLALSTATSLLPEQAAGETPQQVTQLKTNLGTGAAGSTGLEVGHAASNLDVAKTAVVDKLLLGAGPLAKTAQGALLVKTGVDQIKDLPAAIQDIQAAPTTADKITKATELIGGLGLTAFGAAHFANGLVEASRSPEAKQLVEAYQSTPTLANERGSTSFFESNNPEGKPSNTPAEPKPPTGKEITPEARAIGEGLGLTEEQMKQGPTFDPLKVAQDTTPKNQPTLDSIRENLDNLTKDQVDQGKAPGLPADLKKGTISVGKNLPSDYKQGYYDLVTSQAAGDTAGAIVKRNFADLKQPLQEFAAQYQGGDRTGRLADVASLLDGIAEKEKAAGILYDTKSNYLPTSGLWNAPAGEVAKVMGEFYAKNIEQRPGFAQHSTLADIQAGLDAGLKLKTNSVPEILAKRAAESEKAIATKQWFDREVQAGRVSPDYQPGMKEIGSTNYFAHPVYAATLDNYLKSYGGVLRKTANFSSILKRVAFTGTGIPGTGFSPHGINVLIDLAKANPGLGGPISGTLKALQFMTSPRGAEEFANSRLELIKGSQEAGSGYTIETRNTLGTEYSKNAPAKTRIGEAVKGVDNFRKKLYEAPLFEKVIPAMKAYLLENQYHKNLANGMTDQQALKNAGNFAMDALGEVNYDYLMRNKDFQAAVASTIFAPTYNEGHIREVTQNLPKAFLPKNINNPEFAPYRHAAITIGAGLVALDLLNRATSGHSIVSNAPGEKLSLELGAGIKVPGLGTITKIPIFGSFYSGTVGGLEAAGEDIAKNGDLGTLSKTIRGRLSQPAQLAIAAVTNTDVFGRPITTSKQTAAENAKGAASAAASSLLPAAVNAGSDYAQGKINAGQAVSRATGAPVRFAGKAKVKKSGGRKVKAGRVARVSSRRRTSGAKVKAIKSARVRTAKVPKAARSRAVKTLTRR